jgi:hypothetical protein
MGLRGNREKKEGEATGKNERQIFDRTNTTLSASTSKVDADNPIYQRRPCKSTLIILYIYFIFLYI